MKPLNQNRPAALPYLTGTLAYMLIHVSVTFLIRHASYVTPKCPSIPAKI